MAELTQRAPADAADATALEIFQNQWEVYRKFLKYDYLSNAEACAALRRFLTGEVSRPYRFLDLACGDASGIVTALKATPIEHYRGVDLSAPALALAQGNLCGAALHGEARRSRFQRRDARCCRRRRTSSGSACRCITSTPPPSSPSCARCAQGIDA